MHFILNFMVKKQDNIAKKYPPTLWSGGYSHIFSYACKVKCVVCLVFSVLCVCCVLF